MLYEVITTATITDIQNDTGVGVDVGIATGTILDNDAQPNVSIAVAEADAAGVTEGGTVHFVVTQDAYSDSDTIVTVDLNDGTAQAPGDYTDNTYTVTIPAGSLTADLIVEVPTVNDSVDEPASENFTATITDVQNDTGVGVDVVV